MNQSIRTIIPAFAIVSLFGAILLADTIDLTDLFDYENQPVPNYINRDNTGQNEIDNAATTLGRVLFYDKNLSSNNTVSCASCHQQEFAFSDLATVSQGVNGVTGRHSMRLVNSRFSEERRFFWDERAATLEDQVTQPIQDHGEMGFSGTNGDPDFDDLIAKMEGLPYYKSLFTYAFGDEEITEGRMQLALAQFIRSIQSFDSKFDAGLTMTNGNINAPFPNFTQQENQGKALFFAPPQFQNPPPGMQPTGVRIGGGLGCAACHQGPEFSIDPQGGQQRNNGVISVAGDSNAVDLTNSRSPTLRDIFSPEGFLNGPMMHDGSLATFGEVLDHYNDITFNPGENPNLDNRLRGGPQGPGQKLMMTQAERAAMDAFMKTLSGTDVYTNERWSDPFAADGTLELIGNVSFDPIEIDDNSGQRSLLESMTIRFDGDVQIQPGTFTMKQRNDGVVVTDEAVSIDVAASSDNGQTVATISFQSHLRNEFGALEDGNYELKIAGHLVSRDGIPMATDQYFGNEEADKLFAYYGDGDGDRDVDVFDFIQFRSTYNRQDGHPDYNPIFDYHSNELVNIFDFIQFRTQWATRIPFDPPTPSRGLTTTEGATAFAPEKGERKR